MTRASDDDSSNGNATSTSTMYIDDRAGSKDLAQCLPKGIPTVMTRLPFGDVMWSGRGPDGVPVPIGVEYKKLNDLCNCITTGRLSGHQLIGMMNEYWKAYLLVEGVWRANPKNGILEVWRKGGWSSLTLGSRRFMASEVTNYLNTLSIMCGIITWQTGTQEESGAWLGATYKWWQKGWEKHSAHKQFNSAPCPAVGLRKPTLVQRVAKELDGVGWEKAEGLSKEYGSVWQLCLADEEDLQGIEGIGKVLAKRIVKQLKGESA